MTTGYIEPVPLVQEFGWAEQGRAALSVDGLEGGPAGVSAWVLHVPGLPWKLLFATVPPAKMGGGWPRYLVSMFFVAVVGAIFGDMVALLGCVLGVPDAVAAVFHVPLWCLFAARKLAAREASADAALLLIWGMNAVYISVQLGLPWLLGALHWMVAGPTQAWYRFLPICTDLSDFLGRLQPRRTRLQKPPNALGVEESSCPRRVLHF